MTKPRARDLGFPLRGTPGPNNAITDVPGIEVGFCTLAEGSGELRVGAGPVLTGVTAILPRGRRARNLPVWAGHFNLNGNGEMTGTHWINDAGYFMSPICLTNTHSVGMVHHGTVKWMIEQYPAQFVESHAWAMPVVAETYDGLTNDICGMHITEAHVFQALNSATSGPVTEGNVGGGAGMSTFEFKGGTGTSSRVIELEGETYTVAALVQSNFGAREDCNLCGVPIGQHLTDNAILTEEVGHEQGSIIVIIATDLPMSSSQLQRLARRGVIGIGRTGSPGGNYSGDIILAFSVANEIDVPSMGDTQPLHDDIKSVNDHFLDGVYNAAVQSIEEAIINAMVAAESVPTVKPPGRMLEAIDHDTVRSLLRQYNKLVE